eukprot:11092833-Prorocentrum_lima.AAC.1
MVATVSTPVGLRSTVGCLRKGGDDDTCEDEESLLLLTPSADTSATVPDSVGVRASLRLVVGRWGSVIEPG